MKKLITLILLAGFTKMNAQIITDRPDQTESSSTVGLGNLQIESGYLVSFEADTKSTLAPTSLFRYGITKGIELRFLSQFETAKQNDITIKGISDLEIGTKIQLFQKEEVNTEIAFLSHVILPTGSKGFSSEKVGTINKLSISHNLTDNTSIGYNIGYDYFGEEKGNATYSIALGIAINEKVGVYIEPFGSFENFENHIANFDTGFTYLQNNNLQFDFSFGTGINQTNNYISVGASWLIEHL